MEACSLEKWHRTPATRGTFGNTPHVLLWFGKSCWWACLPSWILGVIWSIAFFGEQSLLYINKWKISPSSAPAPSLLLRAFFLNNFNCTVGHTLSKLGDQLAWGHLEVNGDIIIFLTVTHAVRTLQWQDCHHCASVFPMAIYKADDNGDKETTKPTRIGFCHHHYSCPCGEEFGLLC